MVRRVRGLHALETAEYGLALSRDLRSFAAVKLRHAREQFGEPRQPVTRRLGEIRAAEKRFLLGREEHGQRPAARALAHHLVRQLVDLVQVGTLFPVDLDVDEIPVHQGRDFGILEGLVRHHVAPMAGGVTDRKQDRLILRARRLQRLLAPGVPIHRIAGVLLQIGAGLASEAVGHGIYFGDLNRTSVVAQLRCCADEKPSVRNRGSCIKPL